MRGFPVNSVKRQQGSTLMIAIVLLLLAGLMALLGMNVGIFEQRSSGNDLRAKVVKHVAEAGLSQGFEFLLRANPTWADDEAKWEKCPDDDLPASGRIFPCGAVPPAVRGLTYRLKPNVGGYTDAITQGKLDSALTQYMLNTGSNKVVGSLDVAYGVAPVLCRVSALPSTNGNLPCAIGMSDLSSDRVVTFVSIAQVRNDSGRMTLTQTVARSSLLAQPAGVPAVVATGSVTPNGGGDIVAMPDAAGEGLDLSIWSRRPVVPAAGAFGTCSRQEWLNSCGIQLSNPTWMTDGSVVNTCTCDKAKKDATPEGWDILDVDNDSQGINKDVRASEFPCDLFEFAFGVKTRQDGASAADDGVVPLAGDNDGFCEKRLPANIPFTPPSGPKVNLYSDVAFLYTNASKIVGGDVNLASAAQRNAPALGPSTSGLVWCLTDCIQSKIQIGTRDKPVILVVDGAPTNHATIFGLVFVRDAGTGDLSPLTGGGAEFKFNGLSAVFGSVLVQGVVPTGSGGGLIYGDRDILVKLGNDPSLAKFTTLLGGWTDRYSY